MKTHRTVTTILTLGMIFISGCAMQPCREKVSRIVDSRDTGEQPKLEENFTNYPRPSPTKALAYSMILPGGGYFYLMGEPVTHSSKYTVNGIAFLLAETAAFIYAYNQAAKDSNNSLLYVVPLGIKIFEFDLVTTDAEKERFLNAKKN